MTSGAPVTGECGLAHGDHRAEESAAAGLGPLLLRRSPNTLAMPTVPADVRQRGPAYRLVLRRRKTQTNHDDVLQVAYNEMGGEDVVERDVAIRGGGCD